jgi:hypothetical protein
MQSDGGSNGEKKSLRHYIVQEFQDMLYEATMLCKSVNYVANVHKSSDTSVSNVMSVRECPMQRAKMCQFQEAIRKARLAYFSDESKCCEWESPRLVKHCVASNFESSALPEDGIMTTNSIAYTDDDNTITEDVPDDEILMDAKNKACIENTRSSVSPLGRMIHRQTSRYRNSRIPKSAVSKIIRPPRAQSLHTKPYEF